MADDAWDILRQHASEAHSLLLRLTLRHDVADDLLHDLFLKLAGVIQRAKNPRAYLLRTAINLAMDWRRRQIRQGDNSPIAHDPPTDQVSLPAEQADEIGQILKAAEMLSELESQAFVLRFIQEQSFDEIAAALQRTAQQCRGLCDSAIKHIRREMKFSESKP